PLGSGALGQAVVPKRLSSATTGRSWPLGILAESRHSDLSLRGFLQLVFALRRHHEKPERRTRRPQQASEPDRGEPPTKGAAWRPSWWGPRTALRGSASIP